MKRVELHPLAREELADATGRYETRRALFIERILSILERLHQERVVSGPVPGVADARGVRRIVVAGFPYSAVFVERSQRRIVLAFAHHRRRPGYWKPRG